MNHLWEVVDVATERLGPGSATGRKIHKVKATSNTAPITRPRSVHNDDNEDNMEDYVNKALSMPNSPSVKSSDQDQGQSSIKARRHHTHHIFDNLLNSRPRAKSTAGENQPDTPGESDKKSKQPSPAANLIRRWSESGSKKQDSGSEDSMISNVIVIGSTVKVLVDYRPVKADEIAVTKGQMVGVLDTDSSRGAYLVRKQPQSLQQDPGWVPTYVLNLLTVNPRRTPAWTFRKFRKPSFSGPKDIDKPSPAVVDQDSVAVRAGESATLSCVLPCGHTSGSVVIWRGPNGDVLLPGSHRYVTKVHKGTGSLTISRCQAGDSGEYTCSQVAASNEETLSVSKVRLLVKYVPPSPGQPKVTDLKGTCATVTWGESSTGDLSKVYHLESRRLRSSDVWTAVKSDLPESRCVADSLVCGETYSFRVTCQVVGGEVSEPSLPSAPLVVPLDHSGTVFGQVKDTVPETSGHWQRDFERKYIELEELGRGRFSVVRKCQEILSGTEVAVKFINRKRQTRDHTVREHQVLSCLEHGNLIRSTGLFLTSTSDAIVLTLVTGTPLFEHFCEDTTYKESDVCRYTGQLLDALTYLHGKNIVHLDLKPENLILESSRMIRVIDFGSSQEIRAGQRVQMDKEVQRDSSLEFLAPEVISNSPVNWYTDMWSVGVILYVCLSGLSPFLDDSDDETTRNILKCDFSFPEEHFSRVNGDVKDLIAKLLCVNPSQRTSAFACLNNFAWIKSPGSSLISSVHLCTLVRRRMKKLNNMTHLKTNSSSSRMIHHHHHHHQIPRPESVYKNFPIS